MSLYKCLLLILLSSTPLASSAQPCDPLIVVVVMVKNEAPFMVPTLQPFMDAGITSFVVFDTGSTDDTIMTTRKLFNTNNITNGYIFKEPFVDFATSRNRAFELAEHKFPNAGFFIMPDAEWYIENAHGLVEFCKQEIHKTSTDAPHSYLIKLSSNTIDFYQQRLLRANQKLRFAGVVHETISIGTTHQVPSTIYFNLTASRQGLAKTKQRWTRDEELLLKEHKKNPEDPRTVFYLAQTYYCLGQLENAYKYYTLRTTLAGYDQEIAEAYLKLGITTLLLMQQKKDTIDITTYTWDVAFKHFMKSYSLRPWRAEPLVEIANYYVEHNELHLAYLYLRRAIEIPYPDKEVLFVNNLDYFYRRYDLLGKCAWASSEFELGEWGVKQALTYAPYMPHLHRNLKLYQDRKAHQESQETQ